MTCILSLPRLMRSPRSLAFAEGQSLGLSKATLEKRLYECGRLASVEEVTDAKGHEKTRFKVRRRIGLGENEAANGCCM